VDDPDSLSYNKSCPGVSHDRSEDNRGRAPIAGALALTALGLNLGVANAAPPSPVTSGTLWAQDKPHGDGHGHGDWHGAGDWSGGPWHGGPGYPGIDACIAAPGPYGYVTGYVCI
jgi:hypothetical protein